MRRASCTLRHGARTRTRVARGHLACTRYLPFAVVLTSKMIMDIASIPIDYRQMRLENYVLDQARTVLL